MKIDSHDLDRLEVLLCRRNPSPNLTGYLRVSPNPMCPNWSSEIDLGRHVENERTLNDQYSASYALTARISLQQH